MTESRADVAMLDSLAVALDPPAIEPSAETLFRLRMAVAEHHGLVGAPRRGVVRTPWWRRPWAVATVVTGMAVAGTSTAMATGVAPVPRSVRAVAHAVGLPIDSPEVADVRHANDVLKKDLSTLGPATAPSTARHAANLERKLAELSPAERTRVGGESHRTLDRARPSSGRPADRRSSGTPGAGSAGSAPRLSSGLGPSPEPRPSGGTQTAPSGGGSGPRPADQPPASTSPSTTPTSRPAGDDGRPRYSGDSQPSPDNGTTAGRPAPRP